MIVQQRSQQVVGRGDGMKITGKMQIQFIHRHYLCITAAGSSTFDTKAGPKDGSLSAITAFLPILPKASPSQQWSWSYPLLQELG